MPIILSLETSTKTCSVALHQEGKLISEQNLHLENSHSSVISPMIQQTLENVGIAMSHVDAIAVSQGPGSYTGLRIGVSTAKGIAYALGIPLIGVSSLHAMSLEVIKHTKKTNIYPMIDARRMEVYTMQLDSTGAILREPYALILDENTFDNQQVVLFGNGSDKCVDLFKEKPNVEIIPGITPSAKNIGALAMEKFNANDFENLAEFEPFYLKAFYSPKAKNPLQSAKGK